MRKSERKPAARNGARPAKSRGKAAAKPPAKTAAAQAAAKRATDRNGATSKSSRPKPAAKTKNTKPANGRNARPATETRPAAGRSTQGRTKAAVVMTLPQKPAKAITAPVKAAANGSHHASANGKRTERVDAIVHTGTMTKKSKVKLSAIVLPVGYRPSESEPFMSDHQRLYFRNKLLQWKEDIIKQNRETLQILHDDTFQHADLADRATSETDRALELRARDRQRKLISKIDAALARIEDGSYGYCEETGEPISLKRLDARPIATLSLEAQERHERRERVYRED